MPVPFFFMEESAETFGNMETVSDDVFLCSLTKGGTTWVQKILFLLLHGINDAGEKVEYTDSVQKDNQIYPEGLPLTPPVPLEEAEGMEKRRQQTFGRITLSDYMNQKSPRLFSTHMPPKHLPKNLMKEDGAGRLVVVVRNLKDVLSSLHYFHGEAKDGWLGNEHGPGSLARFLYEDTPNAYGSNFPWLKEVDDATQKLSSSGRSIVLYFEALKQGLPEQVQRLADFLGLSLTPAKRDAVVAAVGFENMKATSKLGLLRQGTTCDWKNHMDREAWARFDEVFDSRLDGVAIAEPMRFFQQWEVTGLPPRRAEQTLQTDPRTWPKFVRATLWDGMMVRDAQFLAATKNNTSFVRPPSVLNGIIAPLGTEGAKFVAEAGRYHLFVSGVCPWASSTRTVRQLMGLEGVLGMDVADGQSSAGWVFLDGTSCDGWAGRPGPFFAHELYQASDPRVSTRITVPILWDKKTRCIVSNDSWSICKLLATSFAPLGTTSCDLFPSAMVEDIEAVHAEIYKNFLNGVYRAGIGRVFGNLEGAEAAALDVYNSLDSLEQKLAGNKYLLGAEPTLADVRLAMTLLRYDSSYRCAFALSGGRGGVLLDSGYPALAVYTREMYSRIRGEVDWSSFRQYYRWTGLEPDAPLPSLDDIIASVEAPHGR